jgi:hypothetical protein
MKLSKEQVEGIDPNDLDNIWVIMETTPKLIRVAMKETALELYDENEKLEKELAEVKRKYPSEWFEKGRNSIKRQNQSGCVCIVNDDGTVDGICGAHADWLETETEKLKAELADLNEKIKQIRQACIDTDPMLALGRIEEILEGE